MRSPITGLVDAIVTGLEMFAAWQLFAGPAARWFARRRV
jgi:hypothetical protein